MDAVLRAVAIYLILLVVFRLTGKRTLAQITTFDLVILLIVGESTQQAMLGEDFSIVHATLVIVSLVLLQRGSDYLAWKFDAFDRVTEGVPSLLVSDGEVLKKALAANKVKEADILEAARDKQGLERLDQIKWAVLEASGHITIVPKDKAAPQA
ncbi:DUF421 domain-containing protein [Ornithinimicrobium tianjinense]|uniref:DUF421 domain-containing protein n=1 Tax=Ornithinimicrobium tianjinense TaxID=1195761 RepID=A0A917BF57_9MICO|nr:YetF domain-containing protein [Ornithinimicrobium tianjinense]GGF38811.1 DUF421 domain-containing protein [Ornithinimicrobium tianjinense]